MLSAHAWVGSADAFSPTITQSTILGLAPLPNIYKYYISLPDHIFNVPQPQSTTTMWKTALNITMSIRST